MFPRAIEELADRFPSMRAQLDAYRNEWLTEGDDEPGLFNYLGDIVSPRFLEPALSGVGPDSDEALRQLLDWLEALASSGDSEERNLAEVGVCERLGDRQAWIDRAWPIMGPRSRSAFSRVQEQLGRPVPNGSGGQDRS